MFKCGMHPAAMYGDEVSGISDGEWKKLQRLASAAHCPLSAGRSLSALWLWYEDPTTPTLIAPILRWAKEVWLSATHPRHETGEHGQFLRLFSLPALCRMWERGKLQRPECWRKVRGPLGAAFLELATTWDGRGLHPSSSLMRIKRSSCSPRPRLPCSNPSCVQLCAE